MLHSPVEYACSFLYCSLWRVNPGKQPVVYPATLSLPLLCRTEKKIRWKCSGDGGVESARKSLSVTLLPSHIFFPLSNMGFSWTEAPAPLWSFQGLQGISAAHLRHLLPLLLLSTWCCAAFCIFLHLSQGCLRSLLLPAPGHLNLIYVLTHQHWDPAALLEHAE